jgi:hypothetical protein
VESHDSFRQSVIAAPQDVSLPVFQELLADGYDTGRWVTNPAAHDARCLSLNGNVFPLAGFLEGLQHAAPIYESRDVAGVQVGGHVGCHCQVVVSGPGKEDAVVTAFGRQ